MEKNCWFCKKWEQHCYWDHLELTNHRFVKVMVKDFTQGMAFPKQFVENFKGELSETINLEVTRGKLWQFSLQKVSDLLFIKDGWKEFVHGHGIKEGEYLVFTCSGNSSFQVQIFDNGGCLREGCHSPAENAITMTKKRGRKQNNLENISKICYSSHVLKNHDCYSSNFFSNAKSKEKHSSGHKFSSISEKSEIKFLNDEAAHLDRKASNGQVSQSSMLARHYFKQETSVLHEAKKLNPKKWSIDFVETPEILELCNAIQLGSPYFIQLMKRTAVNYRFFMSIPSGFISKHFNHKLEKATLQSSQGKKWCVICNNYSGSWGFKGETWKKFAQENCLKVGDTCVFELQNFTRKNAAFFVHIAHAT